MDNIIIIDIIILYVYTVHAGKLVRIHNRPIAIVTVFH